MKSMKNAARLAAVAAALLSAGVARAATATSYPAPEQQAPTSTPALDYGAKASKGPSLAEVALRLPDVERGEALARTTSTFPATVDARDRQ